MQHLNYCRQALTSFSTTGPSFPVDIHKLIVENEVANQHIGKMFADIRRTMREGIKVQLPFNGRVLDDRKMKNITEAQKIHLPFPRMALEYQAPCVKDIPGEMSYSKRIVVLTEDENWIFLANVCYADSIKNWAVFPYIWIPKTNYISHVGGVPKFNVGADIAAMHVDDYEDEVFVLFDLLNALACKNVHIEKSPAKATKQGKKVKAALPFDDYHFLTVDVPGKACVRGEGLGGSHRSPREHLRRGHIRRLESGPIWVNACVVNAGIGSKVGKSYLVRKSA